MVLVQDIIPFHQLFVLQRVSKVLYNVIEGSQQLKLKMFLTYDTKMTYPSTKEDMKNLVKDDGAPLFNPLMGLSPAPGKRLEQMYIFSHFDFRIPGVILKNTRITLYSKKPLSRRVESVKPRLGGSWEKLKICRIHPTLQCRHLLGLVSDGPGFSLTGEDVTMGKLVETLSAWYSRERRRTYVRTREMYTKLQLDVCFD